MAAATTPLTTRKRSPSDLWRRVLALALEVLGLPGSGLLTLEEFKAAAAHLLLTILAGAGLVVAALRGNTPMLWVSGAILVARPLVAAIQCVRSTNQGLKWSYVASVAIVSVMSFQLRPEVVRQVWVEAFKIPSEAMVPAIGAGDNIFVAKGRTPRAGDIVVFRSGPKNLPYAKRVVAVGPASVRVDGVQVSVDGRALSQTALDEPCPLDETCTVLEETNGSATYRVLDLKGRSAEAQAKDPPAGAQTTDPSAEDTPGETTKLDAGEIYVLGDHRDASHDSRHFGAVSLDQVIGVMTMVWWEGD